MICTKGFLLFFVIREAPERYALRVCHSAANANDRFESDAFFAVFGCLVDVLEAIELHQLVEGETPLQVKGDELGNELLRHTVTFNNAS